jgi:heptosyltransferase-2
MNNNSFYEQQPTGPGESAPILLIPYMWIGDYVRCHTVVRLLNERFPDAPVDLLATSTVAPLADYMPGVRKAIVVDLPRKRLPLGQYRALARRLRQEGYGQSLVMPRTWKSALAPFLAGIPLRTGFAGEARFGLVNDVRWGERKLPRMVDRCAALALPQGQGAPAAWPAPVLAVPADEVEAWRQRQEFPEDGRPVVAVAPGAVGPAKRWPAAAYAELARRLSADNVDVWVVGGPGEKELASEIAGTNQTCARDLTGLDLRNAILALAKADVAVSNDSGLLHVAAAIGTPSVGIFGPTSPWHWAPLNPLAATLETESGLPCRACTKPVCPLGHHLCMTEITVERVHAATRHALTTARTRPRT